MCATESKHQTQVACVPRNTYCFQNCRSGRRTRLRRERFPLLKRRCNSRKVVCKMASSRCSRSTCFELTCAHALVDSSSASVLRFQPARTTSCIGSSRNLALASIRNERSANSPSRIRNIKVRLVYLKQKQILHFIFCFLRLSLE